MADLTLNALKKAPLLDGDGAAVALAYTATSSDTSVATVSNAGGGNPWSITGIAAGVTDVTVVRKLDGFTVTHSVEVVAADPFDWHLGAESPA